MFTIIWNQSVIQYYIFSIILDLLQERKISGNKICETKYFKFSSKCDPTLLAEKENYRTGENSLEETERNFKLKHDRHYYYVETDSTTSNTIYQNYHLDFSLLNLSQVIQLDPSTWEGSYLPYTLPVSFPFYGVPVQTIQIWSGGFVTLSLSQPDNGDKETLLSHISSPEWSMHSHWSRSSRYRALIGLSLLSWH